MLLYDWKEGDTNYLETTWPSDYDTSGGWCCTIGHAQTEWLARAITIYLQRNGDQWRRVPVDALHGIDPSAQWGLPWPRPTHVGMKEYWLACCQNVRVERPGPPELIRSTTAKYGLQLRYPNGRVKAAAFDFTEEQLEEFKRQRGWTCDE